MNNLTSIVAYKKYGVPKSLISTLSVTVFHIHKEVQDCFSTYKLLQWSKEFTAFKIKTSPTPFTIERHGETYQVIWITPRGKFIQSHDSSEWLVSFRKAQPEFNIPGYALIKKGTHNV